MNRPEFAQYKMYLPSNIYVANNGKIAPNSDRIRVFAAMAEAANMR